MYVLLCTVQRKTASLLSLNFNNALVDEEESDDGEEGEDEEGDEEEEEEEEEEDEDMGEDAFGGLSGQSFIILFSL